MENLFLNYKKSRIGYSRFGAGPRLALCFHGYGEDATSYAFLEKYAGDQFTFYSIDLPYHGRTEWNEGLIFTIEDLSEIIGLILPQVTTRLRQGYGGEAGQLSLIGFSLGGRVALSLYQAMPAQVEKIVLLAPDGLKINFWYWLSTQTWIGNRLFAFTMKHPGWFFGFLKLLNKLNLVNASIFKFVNYYIGDAGVRLLLYERWTCLRKLRPNQRRIKSLIRQHQTEMRLVYGQHDRIILPARGEEFRKGIEKQCSVTVIHSGHQVLQEKHVAELLPLLYH